MIKCPHCGGDPEIDDVVEANIERYRDLAYTVAAKCCGRGIVLRPRVKVSYTLGKYTGDRTTDDWGNPMKGGE